MADNAAMGTPANERTKAYRARQRQRGHKPLSVYLSVEADNALQQLRQHYPQHSLNDLVSAIFTGQIPLHRHSQSLLHRNSEPLQCNNPPPLHRNSQLLQGNSHPLQCNRPQSRAELATIGHQWRQDGLAIAAIAERFNAEGWTPNQIPKQMGATPRADASPLWTEKAVSQLLKRDYPNRKC